ncbi:hypothetical protein [Sporosarcina ureae]|uniref:DUF3953 domain-containing protein n=1 Tax=Sporosarcina ureae TaxID=1571 RepID=A0ABM6JRY8_SPOUR|nr:hypothetical protein [Sporosarcina ureae]ARF12921.1 hypothetical protein SporoS204_01260 [Sporosarcina ureae]
MLKILNIALPITVVLAGIIMLVTKRFEYMIYYVLLLGGFTLFTSIRDIRKKEDEGQAYMNIIIFVLLLILYIFIFVLN